jgi:hypothetical protein
MAVFDMVSQSIGEVAVPGYVPTVGCSLIYLEAGQDGVLVVLGSRTERDGVLSTVRRVFLND